jgi:hypothetical protein
LATRIFPLFRFALFALARGIMTAGMMMLANPVVLAIVAIVAALALAGYMIWKHWDTIKAAFGSALAWLSAKWHAFKALFANGGRGAWDALKSIFMAGVRWFVGLHVQFAQIGANLISGLINGFLGKVRALKNAVVGVAGDVKDWFARKLGIRSPSRVFMGLGGFLTEGLAIGVAKGAAAPLDRVAQLAKKMGTAMAIGAAAPAFAAGPGQVAGSSGLSLAAAPAPAPASGAAAAAPVKIEIHIHQLPGQSAQDLGAELERRLDDYFRRQQASAGASYYDD